VGRIAAIISLFFCCLVFGTAGLEAAKKDTAIFNGSINNIKVKFLSGEVSVAGSNPYLLLSILYQGDHWMLDVKGITKNSGRARISIYAMHRKGRKIAGTYNGAIDAAVLNVKGRPSLRGSTIAVNLKSRGGRRVLLKGILYWDVSALPAAPKTGKLKMKFGNISVGPEKVKLEPWNEGLQLQKLFIVKPGETLNVTLQFASSKPGRYRGTIRIMHFRMIKGQLVSSILRSKNISVKVSPEEVRFAGTVSDKKEQRPVKGIFTR